MNRQMNSKSVGGTRWDGMGVRWRRMPITWMQTWIIAWQDYPIFWRSDIFIIIRSWLGVFFLSKSYPSSRYYALLTSFLFDFFHDNHLVNTHVRTDVRATGGAGYSLEALRYVRTVCLFVTPLVLLLYPLPPLPVTLNPSFLYLSLSLTLLPLSILALHDSFLLSHSDSSYFSTSSFPSVRPLSNSLLTSSPTTSSSFSSFLPLPPLS